ncbi:MAG: B12-binding domain-containing radical SAM protein [Deltaproteobacteria bacterium]|nr:B12-binding domain-containing radical SAM protein [Deltaproteobacteria bacterium]
MSRAVTLVNLFQSGREGERLMPLGALWLRAACEARGVAVDLRDLQFLPWEAFASPDAIADAIGETHPVVGLSCMTDLLPLAVAVAGRLKARDPTRVVVLGGWGPSTVAGPLADAFPHVDFVARGEGDETLPNLVCALADGDPTKVKGLDGWWRGARFRSPDQPPVADVAALAEPRIDDLDLSAYSYYTTVTARGCPYQCAFCEIPTMETRTVRARSVERVVAELVHVHERHGVDFVGIQDDIFLLSRRRVDAILDGLEAAGVRMRWSGFARANAADEGWLARLAERGCDQVTFGIEAGADTLLSAMTKALTVEKAFTGLTRALRHVSTRCYFLWGFPFETLDDFLGTAHAAFLAAQLGVVVEIGHVVPLAGSPLYLEHTGRGGALELHARYPFGRIIQPPATPELFEMVAAHPRVFPAFYAFPTPDRDAKWALAPGLRPHRWA